MLTAPVAIVVAAVALAPATALPNSRCENSPTKTTAAVGVYDAPPSYSTGAGWKPGRRIDSLPRDAAIVVCERRWIGFIGDRRLWLRIAFANKEGWIPDGATGVGSLFRDHGLGIVRDALAGDDQTIANLLLDATPTALPLHALAFAAMLLGMVFKGLFDHLQQEIGFKDYLRRTARAFLVAPIVFQAGLTVADLDPTYSSASFALLLTGAFHNGFFWQTLLVNPTGSPAGQSADDAAAAVHRPSVG